jgi:hypothetical protein
MLVVDGRCGARKVVYLIYLNIEGEGHVVPQHLEIGIAEQVGYALLVAGEIVVGTNDLMPVAQQSFTQMRSQKTCTTGYQYSFSHVVPACCVLVLALFVIARC